MSFSPTSILIVGNNWILVVFHCSVLQISKYPSGKMGIHQVKVEMVLFQEPSFGIFYGIGQVAFTSGVSTVCPWQVQPVLQLSATLSSQSTEKLTFYSST